MTRYLTSREEEALALRQARKTFAEIGSHFGVSMGRARQIFQSALSKKTRFSHPFDVLTTGTRTALERRGICTVEMVQEMSDDDLLSLGNLGDIRLAEIREAFHTSTANWVGEGVPS